MTIVVNAVAAKVGGAVTYLQALLLELQSSKPPHQVVFYVPTRLAELGRGLPDFIQWRPVRASEGSWLRRLWWDQVALRRRLKKHGAGALFSFADFAVFRSPVPQLLLLQNSIYFSDLFRENILPRKSASFRFLYRLRRWLACRSVRTADAVMTPSASMLELVRGTLPLPESKASVNRFGLAPCPRREAPARDYGGPVKLFFPAYSYDHKNLSAALEALRLLQRHHRGRFRLITTANPLSPSARGATANWESDRRLAEELQREGAVEFLAPLPQDELSSLYRSCHVLCYPTLTESFGFPLVEALASGLPVVASDIPVNRELAGGAALYFDPFQPAQLADCLARIAEDADLRARLQEQGYRQVQELSWSRHLDELIRRLEILAGGSSTAPACP